LQVVSASDGPLWAERAHRHNPANFALALLGVKLYPSAEAVAVLRRLLDCYAPTFLPEEVPAAAAAFSGTIKATVAPLLTTPAAVALLRRACEVFPQSACLANLLGQALYLTGDPAGSHAEYLRALQLRQAAQCYRAEYPKDDGAMYYWQFAEHI